MSTSRLIVTAWTSRSTNTRSSTASLLYKRKYHSFIHDNKYAINRNTVPRIILSASNNDKSMVVNNTETTPEVKDINDKQPFRIQNIFQMLGRRLRRITTRSYSSATDDKIISSTENEMLSTVDKEVIAPEPKITNKTFFINVNEKVKEIQANNTTLDPRTIFFSNDTIPDDLKLQEESVDLIEELDNEATFPTEMFNEYKDAVEELLESNRGLKREDPEDIEIIKSWILHPSRTASINLPILTSNDSKTEESSKEISKKFSNDLQTQKDLFLTNQTFTKDQYLLAMRVLCTLGDYCAKRMLLSPIIIAWEKVKESGMKIREPAMNTYLYIVGNAMHPSIQNATDIDTLLSLTLSEVSFGNNIIGEVALFHDLLYKPTENSITLRIKNLLSKNQIADAESLLSNFKDKQQLKLRTYFPVLKAYCEMNDVKSAFRIFYEMRMSPNVYLEPENYVLFLSTLVENKVFT